FLVWNKGGFQPKIARCTLCRPAAADNRPKRHLTFTQQHFEAVEFMLTHRAISDIKRNSRPFKKCSILVDSNRQTSGQLSPFASLWIDGQQKPFADSLDCNSIINAHNFLSAFETGSLCFFASI